MMEAIKEKVTFKKYSVYKKSGVEYLGDIPADWDTAYLGSVIEPKSDKGHPNYEVLSVYRDYGVIPKDSRDDNHNATALDTSSYKAVEPGDLVVNKMKAWQGSMGISDYKGIVSPAYITCKVRKDNFDNKYLHYLLRSYSFIGEYNRLSYGVRIGQWDMHYEDFKKVKVLIPSLQEQSATANFLDRKTAKIDEAIEIKEQEIELLIERKRVLIHKAVTQGLNPDVSLKPSRVNWIGEIPAHWDVLPGLHFFEENKRDNTGMKEDQVLSLSYGRVIEKPPEKLVGLVPESFETYQIVEPGDIIIRCTDLQNDQTSLRTGIAKNKGIITSAYLNLSVKTEDHPEFLHFYLHALDITKILYKFGSGLRQNLSFDDFKRLPVLKVPRREQEKIVEFLKDLDSKTQVAISCKEDEIEKLKEYKTTLINSAVTGKIKVS